MIANMKISRRISLLLIAMCLLDGAFSRAENEADESVLTTQSEALSEFKAERPDFVSDNQRKVALFDQELAQLRQRYRQETVDLEKEEVRTIAPHWATFVAGAVKLVAQKADIQTPGVLLRLADDQLQYNAAAHRASGTVTKTTTYYKVYADGRKEFDREEKVVEKYAVSDIEVGAELVRLFIWRKAHEGLFAAILGHEVGHIVFEHNAEDPQNEHQADLFAAKLLRRGKDLITALDMLSLAAHSFNSLKDVVTDKHRVFDLIRAATNRLVQDVPDLGELGKASSHAYVATAVHNALRKAAAETIKSGDLEEAFFEVYQAVKRACTVPSAVFGMPKEKIAALCLEMERKASYLSSFKNTHPTPFNRNSFIAAVSAQ